MFNCEITNPQYKVPGLRPGGEKIAPIPCGCSVSRTHRALPAEEQGLAQGERSSVFPRNASHRLTAAEKFPFGVYMVLASSRWPGTRLKSRTKGQLKRWGSQVLAAAWSRGGRPPRARPGVCSTTGRTCFQPQMVITLCHETRRMERAPESFV